MHDKELKEKYIINNPILISRRILRDGDRSQLQHNICKSETCFLNYFCVVPICVCSALVEKFYNVCY